MDIIGRLNRDNIKWIALQFMDIKGVIHQVSVRYNGGDDLFVEGAAKLDGSSIEGFKDIAESDLSLKPDPSTYNVIPWNKGVARFIVDIVENEKPFEKDGRLILKRVLKGLDNSGYKAYVGPEIEFFIFQEVKIDLSRPESGMEYRIYCEEAPWNVNGYPRRYKEGYYPAPPLDTLFTYRDKLSKILEDDFHIEIDAHHHEVAATGQVELDIRYDNPLNISDKILTFKYVAKNLASQMGYYVTFIPKPLYGDNGSGMHIHISLWEDGENLFYDPGDKYANLSQLGRYFIGGLIEHSRSLSVFVAPTVNSYKRLVPGYEAPVYLIWSRANRSAAIRVPMYKEYDEYKRIEYRPPDPSMNPYIGVAAILAAGLDGIRKSIDPGDPLDVNVYTLNDREMKERGIKTMPRDLYEAVEESKSDYLYLSPYMSDEFLETYWELKLDEYKKIMRYPTTPELYYYFHL